MPNHEPIHPTFWSHVTDDISHIVHEGIKLSRHDTLENLIAQRKLKFSDTAAIYKIHIKVILAHLALSMRSNFTRACYDGRPQWAEIIPPDVEIDEPVDDITFIYNPPLQLTCED